MRVLMTMNLPYFPTFGGANKNNRYVAEALARRGHAVRVVVPALGTPSQLTHAQFLDALAAEGIRVSSDGAVDTFTWNDVEVHAVRDQVHLRAQLVEQLRSFAPDWALVAAEEPTHKLLEAALDTGLSPVLVIAQTPSFLPFGPQSFYPSPHRTRLLERAATIVASSRYLAAYIRQWGGLAATAIHMPAYGDGPFPHLGRFENRFVTMVNPCQLKGIAIFAALAQALPDVQFAAVPTWGTTEADRQALVGIPNVRIVAPRSDFDLILAETRVLLMPSLWQENFPLSAIEAMLRGVPVLASDVGGLPEAKLGTDFVLPVRPIERFADRLDDHLLPAPLVPEQDIGPWVAALRGLLSDRAAYNRQSAAAREVALRFVGGLSITPLEALLRRHSEKGEFEGGSPPQESSFHHGLPATNQPLGSKAGAAEPARAARFAAPLKAADLSPEKRALLMLELKRRAAARAQPGPASGPTPVARAGDLPLSFAQQRLWFLDQLEPGHPFYTIPTAVHLDGPLDIAALQRSLGLVVQRHEILRTTFVPSDGHPVQVIAPTGVGGGDGWAFHETPLPVVDLRDLPQDEREAVTGRLALSEFRHPFDLAHGPLIRARLLWRGADDHILLLAMHHIVADGWSLGVLLRDLAAFYQAHTTRESEPLSALLSALPIQYADFAHWQRRWLESTANQAGSPMQIQLAYWKEHLADLPTLKLPTDRARPTIQSFRGATTAFTLAPGLAAALAALSQREGVTLFMTLLAAFQVMLARYSSQTDIAVGSPIANRTRAEIEGLIGFFVNQLVLRCDLSGDPTFRELLRRVREVCLGAYGHQDLPFEKLVEELQPERSLSHQPLFQVGFALQNAPMPELTVADLTLRPLDIDTGTAKFDLSLYLTETPAGLAGSFEYSTDLFDATTIARMIRQLQTLLEGIALDPGRPLSALPLLPDEERRQVLHEWNATRVEYPQDRAVHQLFEAQAERTPNDVAVMFNSQFSYVTYRELNGRANQLAHHLRALGVGPEARVGICLDRSLELVVALLAVLKAGGAYVPLDPTAPAKRLAFMLHDAQVKVLLTTEEQRTKNKEQRSENQLRTTERKGVLHTPPADDVSAHSTTPLANPEQPPVIDLIADWPTIARESEENPARLGTLDNLAYVVYTSGSMGVPKGALVSGRGLLNLCLWYRRHASISEQSRVLLTISFSSDAATKNIITTLIAGGQLLLANAGPYDPANALEIIERRQVTLINTTPSFMHLTIDLAAADQYRGLASLTYLSLGGEPLMLSKLRPWIASGQCRCVIHNFYGPTECSDISTTYQLDPAQPDQAETVPIGKPIDNMQVYILDRHANPQPIGVPGELCIGGDGLARGYLNRPELTAERFVPRPWSVVSGQLQRTTDNRQQTTDNRLYRTGDLCRYREDGAIEFLGRIDGQVKIRGYRVEPGEIEALLEQHGAVREAVVVAADQGEGDRRLIAYIVPNQEQRTKNQEQTSEEFSFSILNSQFSIYADPAVAAGLRPHLRPAGAGGPADL